MIAERRGGGMPVVTIHTDGCVLHNPCAGGWAALLTFDEGKRFVLCDNELYTTSVRMELTAAIKALRALPSPCEVMFYTDFRLICDGMAGLLNDWIATGKAGVVSNADLWKQLRKSALPHEITWNWIKGHSGNYDNEYVHRQAFLAAYKAQQRMKK